MAAGRVALPSADARVVALRIAFAGGSADDPPGKEGLTELVATTMAEGGTKDLSYAELATRLYPLAAKIGRTSIATKPCSRRRFRSRRSKALLSAVP